MNSILLIIIGLISGIISGMGIGGGAILIPALTLLVGIEQKQAQALNLIYFIPTAIAALISHIKQGNISVKYLVPLIIFGIIGAVIGSLLALSCSNSILKLLFGIFLGIIGINEITKGIKTLYG